MTSGPRRGLTARPGKVLASALLLACVTGWVWTVARASAQGPAAAAARMTWFCPMHPDVTASEPGKCRKCEMVMLAGDPFDTRDVELTIRTTPAAPTPGVPFQMTLTAHQPGTGEVITGFEEVHEKRYHLFIISQDMSSFQHVHPAQQPDGAWTLEATVPAPGYYRVLSDFVPIGGAPQFLGRTLVTANFAESAASQAPRLTADADVAKTVDGLTATVSMNPGPLLAGSYGHLTFHLTTAAGVPVTDLQPYLGAFGHMLMMSEDMADHVHAHPSPGPGSDVTRGSAGPDVEFEGYLPRPGLYRAWTQFQRAGRVVTIPFTFRVSALGERLSAAPAMAAPQTTP